MVSLSGEQLTRLAKISKAHITEGQFFEPFNKDLMNMRSLRAAIDAYCKECSRDYESNFKRDLNQLHDILK